MQAGLIRIEVDQPRGKHLVRTGLVQKLDGGRPIGRIVFFIELFEHERRAIVKSHDGRFPGLVVDLDFLISGNIGYVVQRILVLAAPTVAFGRFVAIIKCHAGTDDVQHRGSVEAKRGLDQLGHLLRVPREGASYEAAVGGQRFHTKVDRHKRIRPGIFQRLLMVGGC